MMTSYNQQLWIVTAVNVSRQAAGEVENRRKLNISVDMTEIFRKEALVAAKAKGARSCHQKDAKFSRKRVMICHEDGRCVSKMLYWYIGYVEIVRKLLMHHPKNML